MAIPFDSQKLKKYSIPLNMYTDEDNVLYSGKHSLHLYKDLNVFNCIFKIIFGQGYVS